MKICILNAKLQEKFDLRIKAASRTAPVDFEGRAPDFEQLFDLVNDPAEERNLIEDVSQAARIASFRERSKQCPAELIQAGKDMKRYPR